MVSPGTNSNPDETGAPSSVCESSGRTMASFFSGGAARHNTAVVNKKGGRNFIEIPLILF
jgi:hypothetical protein